MDLGVLALIIIGVFFGGALHPKGRNVINVLPLLPVSRGEMSLEIGNRVRNVELERKGYTPLGLSRNVRNSEHEK
jgi:hypothetical protein